jgi:hypothetical protein
MRKKHYFIVFLVSLLSVVSVIYYKSTLTNSAKSENIKCKDITKAKINFRNGCNAAFHYNRIAGRNDPNQEPIDRRMCHCISTKFLVENYADKNCEYFQDFVFFFKFSNLDEVSLECRI